MPVVKCRATSVRLAQSLKSATVIPKTGDEEDMISRGVLNEDTPLRNTVDLTDEKYDDGIAVIFENADNGNHYERFFSENEIRALININRRLTDEEMMSFGNALISRKDPIPIGTFDKDVSMDRINVVHHLERDTPQILIRED